MAFTLTSPVVEDGGPLPVEHTCDGRDRSPALRWSDAPAGTRSFAVTVVDLDHPAAPFAHWLIFDLPGELAGLPGSIPSSLSPAVGGLQGRNDFRRIGWAGPCPPAGDSAHRYELRVRALDVASCAAGPGATLAQLERAMVDHVLAEAALVVTCARPALTRS